MGDYDEGELKTQLLATGFQLLAWECGSGG
jgi:hypothetical protein